MYHGCVCRCGTVVAAEHSKGQLALCVWQRETSCDTHNKMAGHYKCTVVVHHHHNTISPDPPWAPRGIWGILCCETSPTHALHAALPVVEQQPFSIALQCSSKAAQWLFIGFVCTRLCTRHEMRHKSPVGCCNRFCGCCWVQAGTAFTALHCCILQRVIKSTCCNGYLMKETITHY